MGKRLGGRVVVITGGARGIGFETAKLLVSRGARVALLDIDQTTAQASANLLGDSSTVLAVQADVRDPASLSGAVQRVIEVFGRYDTVLVNAGICPELVTFRAMDQQAFDRVLDINLGGAVNTVRATIDEVVRNSGQIIFVSSVYAFNNGALQASYAMSKAGLEAFGRALRLELKPLGVDVSVAYFGYVDTALISEIWSTGAAEHYNKAIPAFLQTRLTPQVAARTLARLVARPKATVVRPRRWRPVMALRGIFGPIAERTLSASADFAEARNISDRRKESTYR